MFVVAIDIESDRNGKGLGMKFSISNSLNGNKWYMWKVLFECLCLEAFYKILSKSSYFIYAEA